MGIFSDKNIIAKSDAIEEEEILEPTKNKKKFVPEPIDLPIEEDGFDVIVIKAPLRKRSEPDTNAEVVGKLELNEKVHCTEDFYGWGHLEDGSWIMLKFTIQA